MALRLTPSGEPVWGGRKAAAFTAYVLARDGYRCRMIRGGKVCGRQATTADHIRPVAEGGAVWDLANLRAACGPCNYGAGAEIASRRRRTRTPDLDDYPPPSRRW